jgi:hypothetical protein
MMVLGPMRATGASDMATPVTASARMKKPTW